jgi:hypothetical protein
MASKDLDGRGVGRATAILWIDDVLKGRTIPEALLLVRDAAVCREWSTQAIIAADERGLTGDDRYQFRLGFERGAAELCDLYVATK